MPRLVILEGKKILIIDDEPFLLENLEMIFEEEGLDVRTLESGVKIEEEIENFDPDLILLDVYLPEINGDQIAKTLKSQKEYSDIPIILMSAADDFSNKLDEIKADAFVAKPFNINDLLKVATSVLKTD